MTTATIERQEQEPEWIPVDGRCRVRPVNGGWQARPLTGDDPSAWNLTQERAVALLQQMLGARARRRTQQAREEHVERDLLARDRAWVAEIERKTQGREQDW